MQNRATEPYLSKSTLSNDLYSPEVIKADLGSAESQKLGFPLSMLD
jgi:hypothetical protein